MKKYSFAHLVLILSASVYTNVVLASSDSHFTMYTNHKFEVSAAGGPNWYSIPNTHVVISPSETDSDHINQIANNVAWKLGIGYFLFEDYLQQRNYLNQLLLEMNVYKTNATARGNVWQYQLQEFNNYQFSAPISSTRLMFDVKPTLFNYESVAPYVILGIGAAWNTVSYHEKVTGADVDPSSPLSLSNDTSTQLAWDIGAGARVALADNLSLTLEYIYAFLGNGSPSNVGGPGISLKNSPSFSLKTQSVLLGLSLKF